MKSVYNIGGMPLLENGTDIHTLAKQTGNSAAMIERHYNKLTATMVAEKLTKYLLIEVMGVI
jgi:hypothetical protein